MTASAGLPRRTGARIDVDLIGAIAARALVEGRRGHVAALFERSIYLDLADVWVCVGGRRLGAGPLNALVAPGEKNLAPLLALTIGEPVRVSGRALASATGITLDFDRARRWEAPSVASWSDESLRRGLVALDTWLEAHAPREGLGALAHSKPCLLASNPVARRAGEPLAALHAWLDHALGRGPGVVPLAPAAIAPLVGLGPGLTPSGDDFLGGALIALHLLGRAETAQGLAAIALPLARRDSNPVSAAHLAAASEGQAHERLHDALARLIAGETDALPPALSRLAALGHCSGLDGLAGAASVLRKRARP